MKWVRDDTGRFRQRPHYTPDELEQTCENAICDFLQKRHGKIAFPVSTADLTVMIEQAVDDLDRCCELEEGVDGLTDFFPRKRAKVKIASRLQQPHLENRLRTTLTHEYGHVILHGFLFGLDEHLQNLFEGPPRAETSRCHRDGNSDWMEWQAGYACGALLMPLSELKALVRAFRKERDLFSDIGVSSEPGRVLVGRVVETFQVSHDAARVRLEKRNLLVRHPSASLFG